MGVPVDTGLSDRILDRDLPTVLIDSSHPRFTSIVLDEACVESDAFEEVDV